MARFGILTTTILGLMLPHAAHAGAWTLPEGKGLLINELTYYSTNSYFDAEGERQSQPRFTKYELKPYVEYGLMDRLTIGGSVYLQHVQQSGGSNRGIADPEIFARWNVWKGETQLFSLQPLIKLPSNFASDNPPRGGSRTTDLELSLLYGRSQPILFDGDYIDVRVGYRKRNRGLSDVLVMDSAIGFKPSEQWEIIPALRSVVPTAPTDVAVYSENGELDYAVLKAEAKVIYHMDSMQWLQGTVFSHVQGVQTGDGMGFSLGYARRF